MSGFNPAGSRSTNPLMQTIRRWPIPSQKESSSRHDTSAPLLNVTPSASALPQTDVSSYPAAYLNIQPHPDAVAVAAPAATLREDDQITLIKNFCSESQISDYLTDPKLSRMFTSIQELYPLHTPGETAKKILKGKQLCAIQYYCQSENKEIANISLIGRNTLATSEIQPRIQVTYPDDLDLTGYISRANLLVIGLKDTGANSNTATYSISNISGIHRQTIVSKEAPSAGLENTHGAFSSIDSGQWLLRTNFQDEVETLIEFSIPESRASRDAAFLNSRMLSTAMTVVS